MIKQETPMFIDPNEGLILNETEQTIPSSSHIQFFHDPGFDYKIIIEGAAPENISGGSFDIEFYTSNNPDPDQIQVEK